MKHSSTRRQRRGLSLKPDSPAPGALTIRKVWPRPLPWLALLLIAFLAYLPALRAGFIWDDEALTRTPLIASPGGIWKLWLPYSIPRELHYWPLVYASFWLEHLLFGMRPVIFHLDNILLHGLVCVLFWRVLARLGAPGAWLAAAIFAVHPVHAESVAWVIERKDVLSGALYLAAAWCFLRSRNPEYRIQNTEFGRQNSEDRVQNPESTHNSQLTTHNLFYYMLAIVLFLGALLSKSIVIGLPLALALALWWRKGRLGWRDIVPLLPLAILSAALTGADLRHVAHMQIEGDAYASGLGPAQRLLVAAHAAWAYLGKLAWPFRLAPFYPKWDVNPGRLLPWLPVIAWAGVLAGLFAARRRLGRGPLAAMGFYLLTLGPALGLVDFKVMQFSWMADRFQYLASAGPIALAAAGLTRLAGRIGRPARARAAMAVLLCGLGLLTFRRAILYHDTLTLYSAAREAYPECAMAHYVCAVALLEQNPAEVSGGRGAEIMALLRKSMELQPEANTAVLMGQMQSELKQNEAAEESFKNAQKLSPESPIVYSDWGAMLDRMGRLGEAEEKYKTALALNKDFTEALGGLGGVLRKEQKYDEAASCLARAVKQDPDTPKYRVEYGLALANQKKTLEARAQLETALRLDPNNADAHLCLALVLLEQQGRPAEAASHFESSLNLAPNPVIYHKLGLVYEQMGNLRDAARCYRAALALQADFAPAAERLGALGAGSAK